MPQINTNQTIVVSKDELKKGVKFCVIENNTLIETYTVNWKD